MARLVAVRSRQRVRLAQTILTEPRAIARVQLPVPHDLAERGHRAAVRLVVAWLTPVNAAVLDKWSCRKVSAHLKTGAEDASHLKAGHGARGAYPVSDRTFDISDGELQRQKADVSSDTWVLEISYEEVAPSPAGMEFTRQQKVGVAIELYDEDERPVDPQAILQKLPLAATMNRLSVIQVPFEIPIALR